VVLSAVQNRKPEEIKDMKILKQAVTVMGSLVAIAVITAFVAPKMAHPLVGTLAADEQTVFVASEPCYFGTSDTCAVSPLYTVPMDKIAVIESASGDCVTVPPSTIREFQLQFTGPGGTPVQMSLPPSPGVVDGTFEVSVTGLNIKSYAFGGKTGTPLSFYAYANATQTATATGEPFCHLTVSGYLAERR
jgi:hypothetical protein